MFQTRSSRCIWLAGLVFVLYTVLQEVTWEMFLDTRYQHSTDKKSYITKTETTSSVYGNSSRKVGRHSEDNSTARTPEDPWLVEQEKRAKAIRKECKGWNKNPSLFLPSHRDNLTYLLVDDRHKAIYCYIAKVACTNWKRMWMILTGLLKIDDPLLIPEDVPHKIHEKMMLIKQPYKTSVLQEKLRTYTKFMIVRHPYERLLSAYRDKFEGKGKAHYKKNYAQYIMQTYRKNSSDYEIPPSGDGLTFSEFVTYIVNLPKGDFDEHWKPYSESCYPCAIQYDVVAKYESLKEDSERFLRLIRAPDSLHFPPFRESNTSNNLASYMDRLSFLQRKALYSTYEKDFKMFGYSDPFHLGNRKNEK